MAKLRIYRAVALAQHKLRIYKATASGTGTTPKLRIYRGSVAGTVTLALLPMADLTAEAFDVVSMTAFPTSASPAPSSYAWRQISGPTVSISVSPESSALASFVAPAAIPGATVVLGITGSLNGASSPEVTVTIVVTPHISWVAGSSTWLPVTKTSRA